MKRTTIFVPESLERDLQLLANRDRKATAAVVREALAEYVAKHRQPHVLPSFVGAFASGQTDTAERHEELLFAKLSPHADTKAPSKRAPAATRKRSPSKPRRSRS